MIDYLLASADCFATQYGTQCEDGEATPGALLVGLALGVAYFGYIIYSVRNEGGSRHRPTPLSPPKRPSAPVASPHRVRTVQRKWIAWSAAILFVVYTIGVVVAVAGKTTYLTASAYTEQGQIVDVSVDCGSALFGNYPTDDEIDAQISVALSSSGLPQDTQLSLNPSGVKDVFPDLRQRISGNCDGARDTQKSASAPKLISLLVLGILGFIGLVILAYRPVRSS